MPDLNAGYLLTGIFSVVPGLTPSHALRSLTSKEPKPVSETLLLLPIPAAQARRGPTTVPAPRSEVRLKEGGVALRHQLTTLDRTKLGQLSLGSLAAIEQGVLAALDLSSP